MTPAKFSTHAEECFFGFVSTYCGCKGLLVALSGGADSVVLLHLAHRYRDFFGERVEALHVHHGIRGEEANRDLAFCRDICGMLNIPFTAKHYDIPTLAQEAGWGIEETARHYRYLALDEHARARNLSHIATAHTATDNMETVLFQLTRGAAGVIGIPSVRDNYIRPLLSATRQDVLDYLTAWNLPHVEDSTNTQEFYSRNLIRHRVLPVLQGLNPKAADAFLRVCAYSKEDTDYLNELTRQAAWDGSLSALFDLPRPIQRRAVLSYCHSLGFPNLSSAHLDALLVLLQKGHPHASLSLPGGKVVIENGRLTRASHSASKAWEISLQMGENHLPDGSLLYLTTECEEKIKKYISSPQNIYKLLTKTTLPFAIIDGVLTARSKRPGDRILSGGMHRKVKKLFNEASLPLDLRNTTPLICLGEEILWIPHLPLVRDQVVDTALPYIHLLLFIKGKENE